MAWDFIISRWVIAAELHGGIRSPHQAFHQNRAIGFFNHDQIHGARRLRWVDHVKDGYFRRDDLAAHLLPLKEAVNALREDLRSLTEFLGQPE
jgi:hypothetical protein